MPAATRTRAEIEERINSLTDAIRYYEKQQFLSDLVEARRRRDELLDEWTQAR